MADLIESVIKDLSASHNAKYRVALTEQAPLIVFSDATMVRMLLRNLIQNALQHTTRQIQIHIRADSIDIADQGGGLTADQRAALSGTLDLVREGSSFDGVALYIVTYITCGESAWR